MIIGAVKNVVVNLKSNKIKSLSFKAKNVFQEVLIYSFQPVMNGL
jgi:sporulation protein YlmC with PRC-barrel domain